MAGENDDYRAWCRDQRCAVDGCRRCPCEAHHAGRSGMAMRAHDSTCVPLCTQHHTDWHAASGPFKRMKKADRRAWAEANIRKYNDLYRQQGGEI